MATDPLTRINTRTTPQGTQARPDQVKNYAGGYVFKTTDEVQIHRFLTLGTTGGSYYATEDELTEVNADLVLDWARHRTVELVNAAVGVSVAGRAPRQQSAIFALAAAAGLGDKDGRRDALMAVPVVCRTGATFKLFLRYVKQFRGWGRGLRDAVARWYNHHGDDDLIYQLIKYRQRYGYTDRDILRLGHPMPNSALRDNIYGWLTQDRPLAVERVQAFGELQRLGQAEPLTPSKVAAAAELVQRYRLPWEAVPDQLLNEAAIWEAQLQAGIPQTALMRQLPRLTNLGLLTPTGSWTMAVAQQLANPDRLTKARVHPLNVLIAHHTYAGGRSLRGKGTWEPSRPIVDALDAAFYAAYGAVEPTGKRIVLALDVSGSMSHQAGDLPLQAREVAAALALVTANVEQRYEIIGFSDGVVNPTTHTWGQRYLGQGQFAARLSISPNQRLADAVDYVGSLSFGRTDCALPMLWAEREGVEADAFVIITDNETWYGQVHPFQALQQYRERVVPGARLVVVGVTATPFSIAEPTDPGSLDVVGFDQSVPQLVADFIRGDL